MKIPLPLLFAACLVSCSMPTHLAEVYYPNGHLAKREFDTNPSIGGVHSQKGADGYQADDDNQQSLRDAGTALGGAYTAHQTQLGNASNNARDVRLGHQEVQNNAITHPVTETKNLVGPKGGSISTSTTTVPPIPR